MVVLWLQIHLLNIAQNHIHYYKSKMLPPQMRIFVNLKKEGQFYPCLSALSSILLSFCPVSLLEPEVSNH